MSNYTTLNTLTDEVLMRVGRKLDSASENQNWYALVQKLPDHLYAGYEGKKLIESIAIKRFEFNSAGGIGSSGYSLLKDLKRKNVSVDELIVALEELGQEECLGFLMRREMPTIIEQPLGTPVMSGSAVELSCRAKGFPLPNYQWFVSRNGGSPEKLPGQFKRKLIIRNASREDEGQYCCRVQNEYGCKFSHYAEVGVVKQPRLADGDERPPIILTHPCNKDVESGQAVELRVTADGSKPLKYEWFKNAKLLEGEMTAVLTLHNAKPGETIGTYSCRVSNRHGSAISSFATVHVIAEIEIVHDLPPKLSVKEGDPLKLEVTIRENPDFPPQYEWRKVSRSEGIDSQFLSDEHQPFLLIHAVEKHHAGWYQCKVSCPGLSKESSLCQVEVSERIQQTFINIVQHPSSHAVGLNERVRLCCRVESSHPVTYQWFKGSVSISSPVPGANGPELDLRINSEQDWDTYRCSVAIDSYTQITNKALIYNMLPIRVTPEHVKIGVDHQVQLQCVVDASYKVGQCRWYKDDQLIPNQNNLVLALQNPTRQTLGPYKCEAISDIYGILKSQVALVQCSVAPVITSPATQMEVSIGEPFEFRCEASGEKLTYQWICEKTGEPIQGARQPVYRIDECSMMHFGSYICSVQNEAGIAQSDMYTVGRQHNRVPLRVTLSDALNINLGKEAKMRVNLSNEDQEYTYQWYFNGQVLSSQPGDRELVIPNVRIQDRGVYLCVVYNQFGDRFESNLLHLNVIKPLQTRSQFQYLSIRGGEETSIGVDVEGESQLCYQWFRDDRPLKARSSSGKIYHVGPMSEDMAGVYCCEVSDHYGQKERVQVAHITVNPASDYSSCSTSVSLIGFSCTGAQQTQSQPDTSQMVPADGQHQVSGAEAAMHDNLSYESVDYPTLGSEEPQSSLGPYQSCYAPNIGIAPKNQEVEAGQELSLSCGASGTEAMYYQWFFNEKPLGERTRCNTVKILKATHQHSGQYYCQVENSKDTVSTAKVVVTVRGQKPRFIRFPKPEIRMPIGQSLMIPCKITGEEPLSVQWKKNGKFLAESFTSGEKGGSLFIPEFKESDSGEYICVISNAHGSVESRPAHVHADTSK